MKCPHCGADLKEKDLCSRCGRKIGPAPEIEIEYKDFKVSEYLEIRQKEHKTSSGTGTGVQKGERSRTLPEMAEKTSENTRGRTPAEGDLVATVRVPDPRGSMKYSSLTVAVILLILAALAGALYLWRFLVR